MNKIAFNIIMCNAVTFLDALTLKNPVLAAWILLVRSLFVNRVSLAHTFV